jgi:hypothetical protein
MPRSCEEPDAHHWEIPTELDATCRQGYLPGGHGRGRCEGTENGWDHSVNAQWCQAHWHTPGSRGQYRSRAASERLNVRNAIPLPPPSPPMAYDEDASEI